MAEQISNNGPLAVKGAKRAVWEGLRYGLVEGLQLEEELFKATRQSQDFKEAMKAFTEKRRPLFKGE